MIDIVPIPAFNDNYLWLFSPKDSNAACIVDPGDAVPVLDYLLKHGLTLEAIFITHHHADHTGGVQELLQQYDVPVFGPRSQKIPAVTHALGEGDSVSVFGTTFRILEIPGHTLDHIAYVSNEAVTSSGPVVFCGDTLFAGGCGRVFEGTHSMMYHSLCKLEALDAGTQVFCAHEYTLANLRFASAVMPEDQALAVRLGVEQAKRDKGIPTVPTTIRLERETNPFLRCDTPELLHSACEHSGRSLTEATEVFGVIREWKDSF